MDEAAWLDGDEQQAWRRLAAVMTMLPAALDAHLQRAAGLTQFSYLVLAMLSEAPDRTLPMSELASTVSSSLSRLSHVVARHEQEGWVRREPSPCNGRITMARLTVAGLQKVVSTAPAHAAEVRRLVFDTLDPQRVDQLAELMAGVLTRLDPEARIRANPMHAPRRQAELR